MAKRLSLILPFLAFLTILGAAEVYAQGCIREVRAEGRSSPLQRRAEKLAIRAWESRVRAQNPGSNFEWDKARNKRLVCSGRLKKKCRALAQPCPTVRRGANANARREAPRCPPTYRIRRDYICTAVDLCKSPGALEPLDVQCESLARRLDKVPAGYRRARCSRGMTYQTRAGADYCLE